MSVVTEHESSPFSFIQPDYLDQGILGFASPLIISEGTKIKISDNITVPRKRISANMIFSPTLIFEISTLIFEIPTSSYSFHFKLYSFDFNFYFFEIEKINL